MGARHGSSRVLVVALLVAGCLCALVAPVALWLRFTALDTPEYVAAVAPAADDPAVQRSIAERVDEELRRRIDFEALAVQVSSAAVVDPPAAAAALRRVVRSRLGRLVRSDEFPPLWRGANRRAHAQVAGLLTGSRRPAAGDGRVTLDIDLGPGIRRLRAELRRRGQRRIAASLPLDVAARMPLVRTSTLARMRRVVDTLQRLGWVLPGAAAACLLGAVALARGRRLATALGAALGVAVAMALVLGVATTARVLTLAAGRREGLPRDATAEAFDALASPLVSGARIALLAAVLAVLALAFARQLVPRRPPGRRLADPRKDGLVTRRG